MGSFAGERMEFGGESRFATPGVACNPGAWNLPGSLFKVRISGSVPDLLNQHLHFHEPSRWFIFTWSFAKCWGRGVTWGLSSLCCFIFVFPQWGKPLFVCVGGMSLLHGECRDPPWKKYRSLLLSPSLVLTVKEKPSNGWAFPFTLLYM